MSLRARFAAILSASIFGAMVLVALVSAVGIDLALRSSLNARLATAARGVGALVDVDPRTGRLSLADEDLRQAQLLVASDMSALVRDRNQNVVARFGSQEAPEPDDLSARFVIRMQGDEAGSVTVTSSAENVLGPVRTALLVAVLAAFFFGSCALALSWNIAGRALAPLQEMALLAEEIEAHDLQLRLQSTSSDETGRLARAFDRMLGRLQRAFERQRKFTADASHELRAPLAVIRAEADVALDRDREADEYRRALLAISDEIARADDVIAALLQAARSEEAPLRLRRCNLNAVARELATRIAPLATSRELRVDVGGEPATAPVDRDLLESGLLAVLHNAVGAARHSISIVTGSDTARAWIDICDDGPGFSVDALQHAVERFWRDPASRGEHGSGLGLAIANTSARRNGGSLHLSNQATGGACVRFSFPFIGASSSGDMLDP